MKELAEFLALARAEGVTSVRFSFTEEHKILSTLTATINDRKYEATEVADPEHVELACKGALYQWCEGMKAHPPQTATEPQPETQPREDGKLYCSECNVQITEHTARQSPKGVCRNAECIQAYWVKRSSLNHKE